MMLVFRLVQLYALIRPLLSRSHASVLGCKDYKASARRIGSGSFSLRSLSKLVKITSCHSLRLCPYPFVSYITLTHHGWLQVSRALFCSLSLIINCPCCCSPAWFSSAAAEHSNLVWYVSLAFAQKVVNACLQFTRTVWRLRIQRCLYLPNNGIMLDAKRILCW
jgi:hypothetical protein